jgi:DNA-binding IclR family transcriptional regulator
MLIDLQVDLPVVLPALLRPWTEVPLPPRQATRLLIARSSRGRVSVARTSSAIATLLQLADGRKSLEDLAREAGLRPAELEATLDQLVELGAVRFSTGS